MPLTIKHLSDNKIKVSINIVLIDDSLLVRERVLNVIAELPGIYMVVEAGNSIEAMEIIEPNVAILDIQMPGLSGVEVLRQLKYNIRA